VKAQCSEKKKGRSLRRRRSKDQTAVNMSARKRKRVSACVEPRCAFARMGKKKASPRAGGKRCATVASACEKEGKGKREGSCLARFKRKEEAASGASASRRKKNRLSSPDDRERGKQPHAGFHGKQGKRGRDTVKKTMGWKERDLHCLTTGALELEEKKGKGHPRPADPEALVLSAAKKKKGRWPERNFLS